MSDFSDHGGPVSDAEMLTLGVLALGSSAVSTSTSLRSASVSVSFSGAGAGAGLLVSCTPETGHTHTQSAFFLFVSFFSVSGQFLAMHHDSYSSAGLDPSKAEFGINIHDIHRTKLKNKYNTETENKQNKIKQVGGWS